MRLSPQVASDSGESEQHEEGVKSSIWLRRGYNMPRVVRTVASERWTKVYE